MNSSMEKYKDILYLPHHVSDHHPRMRQIDRAAQFAPFAALTGFGDVISESGRITGQKMDLDENEKTQLDMQIRILAEYVSQQPEVTVTYFVPDPYKDGGEYKTYRGWLKKLDFVSRKLQFMDRTQISVDEICKIEGEILQAHEGSGDLF